MHPLTVIASVNCSESEALSVFPLSLHNFIVGLFRSLTLEKREKGDICYCLTSVLKKQEIWSWGMVQPAVMDSDSVTVKVACCSAFPFSLNDEDYFKISRGNLWIYVCRAIEGLPEVVNIPNIKSITLFIILVYSGTNRSNLAELYLVIQTTYCTYQIKIILIRT